MMFKVVIDRFEGALAVLLIEPEEARQIVLPRALLPREAEEGSFLNIDISCDAETTAKARREASELLDKIKK